MTISSLPSAHAAVLRSGAARRRRRAGVGAARLGLRRARRPVTFVVDFEATQSAPFLSRDVALEVLPRGHFQSTRALARLIAARRPDASLSALAVANLKHAIAATLAGAAIAPSSPITASAKASRSC